MRFIHKYLFINFYKLNELVVILNRFNGNTFFGYCTIDEAFLIKIITFINEIMATNTNKRVDIAVDKVNNNLWARFW